MGLWVCAFLVVAFLNTSFDDDNDDDDDDDADDDDVGGGSLVIWSIDCRFNVCLSSLRTEQQTGEHEGKK